MFEDLVVALQMASSWQTGARPISWDLDAFAVGIELPPMKWAANATSLHGSESERRASMGAPIAIGPWFAAAITEQHQIMPCKWQGQWLFGECCRWSHCIPAVLCKVSDGCH